MVESQLIIWAKEAGVFKPVKANIPLKYGSYYDLEHNVELGEQEISADSLNLVSSVYLGPLNIFEERQSLSSNFEIKSSYERYAEHVFGIIHRIIKEAKNVAEEKGVPYFGVDIVKTGKNEEVRFVENENYRTYHFDLEKKAHSERKISDYFSESRKPVITEFVLHPTAQLYVPKK
jgi:hypothetical protein